MKKTHGYLTITESGEGFVTAGVPACEHAANGIFHVFDEDGSLGRQLVRVEVESLMGGSIPEAPADKYPHGRTYIVRLEEVGK